MKRSHSYETSIRWTGNTGQGTSSYTTYSRSHVLQAGGKQTVNLSSDPAFRGDASRYNPEELLLASLSSCHMLWYLHLCAAAGVVVTHYDETATGTMQEDENGGGRFTGVILNPVVVITAGDIMLAKELHHQANEKCYIAGSCNFPVKHQPKIIAAV